MKHILLLASVILGFANATSAQTQIPIQWQNCLGGSQRDVANSIIQTNDGGYVVAGMTESIDGDVSGYNGNRDFWVVKISSTGALQWQKCLGGSGYDEAKSIKQTADGGYVVAGVTESTDGDVTGLNGSYDFWVVKLTGSGALQWQQCFGGSLEDVANSIVQTTDGGYILTGKTNSPDGDVSGYHDNLASQLDDIWVVKISSSGSLQWQKCLGGWAIEAGNSIIQTNDGGYAVAGYATVEDGDVTGYNGGDTDLWVVKLSSSGSIQWQKCLGGTGSYASFEGETAKSIIQTPDGGYIVAGSTNSNDGDVTGFHAGTQHRDFWVVKLNGIGALQWQKCLGGTGDDIAYSIFATTDGGCVVAGTTTSDDGDVGASPIGSTIWTIKLSSFGTLQWQKRIGGPSTGVAGANSIANSVIQTTDGDFVLTGHVSSNGGDVSGFNGGYSDYWVVKLHECTAVPSASITVAGSSTICSGDSVVLTANGGGDYLWSLWSGGVTTSQSILVDGGQYSVTVSDAYNCVATADTTINVTYPIDWARLCLITVDSSTGFNQLIWEKTDGYNTAWFKIYKQNNFTSQFDSIGLVHIDSLSVFTDYNSNPNQQSATYYIGTIDSCGNEAFGLAFQYGHTTIHLSANQGINNQVNLQWNAYNGFNYSNFEIYRSNNGGAFAQIGSVANSSFSYTDLNPPGGSNYYYVAVTNPNGCNPSRSVNSSISNILDGQGNPFITGIKDFDECHVIVYPNPAKDIIEVNATKLVVTEGCSAKIINALGQVVLSQTINQLSFDINVSHLVSGSYALQIINPSTNQAAFKRIVIE